MAWLILTMCRLFTFHNNNTLLCFSSALLLFLIQQQQIYIHKVNSQSTDVLIIRHGRSRVRHSTEKDHLRWGLKAFDNLTLEYEDVVELEGSGGNGTSSSSSTQADAFGFYDINGTITASLSSFLYNNSSYNLSYNNNNGNTTTMSSMTTTTTTTNVAINQQREREIIDPTHLLQQPIKPYSSLSSTKGNNNRKNNNIINVGVVAGTQQQKSSNNNKYVKVAKKQIMENIKKDVDKGLEYLRTHSDVLDATVSLIDMKIKRSEAIIKLQQQQQRLASSSTTVPTPTTTESSTLPPTTSTPSVQPIAKSDVVLRQIISEQQSIFSKLKPNLNNKFPPENNDKLKKSITAQQQHKYDNNNNFPNTKESLTDSLPMIMSTSPTNNGPTHFTEPEDYPASGSEANNEVESVENDDELTFIMNDMEDLDGTNAAYQMEEIDLEDLDEVSRENRKNLIKGRDVVTTFLRIVESQHLLGANCTAGTALNLGEGVVDRYAQDRFRVEAEIAVNRANMLTR